MYVVCVSIWVKPGCEEKFIEAVKMNHENTRKEPGNLRFDVSRHEDEPGRFFLYEVYRTKADFAAHHQSAHYLAWKEMVEIWLAQPRQGVRHVSLFPAEEAGLW